MIFWVSTTSASAQNLWQRNHFITLNTPPPSYVNALMEDSSGQIWVGAESGVYRIYNNKLNKFSHAPNVNIEHIFQQSSGEIWLATTQGAWFWRRDNNAFSELSCESQSVFLQITEHSELGLLARSPDGIYKIDQQSGCQRLQVEGLDPAFTIEAMTTFKSELILAARGQGVFRCSGTCESIQAFAPDLVNTRVRELISDGNHIYAGTHKHGYFQLSLEGEVIRRWHRDASSEEQDMTLPVNGVMSLALGNESIWAGLWAGGLQQFDFTSGIKVTSNQHYAPDTTTLGGRHVFSLLLSSEGSLYVGHENGVSILAPQMNQQGWIGLGNTHQIGLTHTNIQSLIFADEYWWVGTSSGGFYRISEESGMQRFGPDSVPQFPTKSVWEMVHSKSGDLLLGTANGILRLSTQTSEWQVFGPQERLENADVYRLDEAPDGSVWIGIWEGGVVRLDESGEILGQWKDTDGLGVNTSIDIKSTIDNDVFVLNSEGLFIYNAELNSFIDSGITKMHPDCANVEHFNKDADGYLWVLCEHNSLWQWKNDAWSKADIPFPHSALFIFPPEIGTESNHTNQINLYLLTEDKVVAINKNGHSVLEYDLAELPVGVEVASAYIAGGKLVTATDHGLYRQDLSQQYEESNSPLPQIFGVSLFNASLQLQTGESEDSAKLNSTQLFNGNLQLNYDQDLVTLEFGLPGYVVDAGSSFNYRLVPFDRSWITTTEDIAQATYTRLPPGEYSFEVKVAEADAKEATAFNVQVLPPWYLTLWAKLLGLVAFIALVLTFIKWRTHQLTQRTLWLEERVKARTNELEQANIKLQQVANLDALTGLLNRRGFRNICDKPWSDWSGQVALMIADIDFFKKINDTYGHDIGDDVLTACSERLKDTAGPSDLIARWGGEEFLILLREESIKTGESHTRERLIQRAQSMQQIIGAEEITSGTESLHVTLTAGVVFHHGQPFDVCLKQADALLYQGKSSGRNKLVQQTPH